MYKLPSREDRERYVPNYQEIVNTLFVNNHSNYLVQVLKLNSPTALTDEVKFIDMELCTANLKEFLREPNNFQGEKNIWKISLHLANAVEFIHGCNVIHGDIKPSNGGILFECNSDLHSPIFRGS